MAKKIKCCLTTPNYLPDTVCHACGRQAAGKLAGGQAGDTRFLKTYPASG